MVSFKDIEKRYFKAKEIHEIKKEISAYCCPICGSPLVAMVGEARGDTLDFKAYIDCKGCRLLHAESKYYSLYEEGNPEAKALKNVRNVVQKIRQDNRYTARRS